MKIFRNVWDTEIMRPTILTMGIFDGLHLGHQQIMKDVIARAKATQCASTVLTFSPHPRAVLHPETAPPMLQTFEQKAEGMGILGIDQLVVMEFNEQLSSMSAQDFTQKIICEALKAQEIYLGKGFAFGRGREGNIVKLQEYSQHFGFYASEVHEVVLRGRRISSTMVRRLIKAGRINLARRLLGRPYGVEGVVIKGRQLGRELQFPTANIAPHNTVIPADGVYVTLALVDGLWRRSVTNIGVRPTIGGNLERMIEAHLLDFQGDLYHRTLRLRFLCRLRDEKKFKSLDELKAQISRDSQRAQRYFQHKSLPKLLEFT